jgi:hypothetical protein
VLGQRLDRALIQHRAQGEGHVGGLPHLLNRHGQRPGQALPAVIGFERYAVPAALGILPIGVPEARRRAHNAVFKYRRLPVADGVQRRQHIGGQLAGFLQDGIDQIGGGGFENRQGRDAVEADDFVQHEAHVPDGGVIGNHDADGPPETVSMFVGNKLSVLPPPWRALTIATGWHGAC